MAKIKVHEIAKELGKQSKDVIAFLQDKGIEVKAAQSSLEEDAAVGGGQAELAGRLRLHAVHVLRIEGQGVEHVAQMDARGVLHIAPVLRQVRPLGSLGGAALLAQLRYTSIRSIIICMSKFYIT